MVCIFFADVLRAVAQRWDRLDNDAKQSYITDYKKELASYSSILEKYKNSLTPEQKEAQEQLKVEKKLMREKRDKKKRLRELEKPKKPATAFFLYLANNIEKGTSMKEYQEAAKKFAEGEI